MSTRAKGAWTSLLNVRGGSSSASRLERTRADLIIHWESNVWNWLTGVDTTTHSLSFLPDREFPQGVPLIWTTDEKDNENPVKPWPTHLEYLKYYTQNMVSKEPDDKFIWIDKSRQKLASTGILLSWDWWCRTEEARRMLWSKLTQEQAADMLNEKVRAVDRRLSPWVRELYSASMTPMHRIRYKRTGSMFLAVNEAAAAGAARGGTATAIGVDEAAYQDQLKPIVVASIPMAGKVVALTTAQVGGPDSGAGYFYSQIKPGRIYRPSKPRKPGRTPPNDNPYGSSALVAIRGYRERLTPGTRYKVIEIDFTADPDKDNPEWLLEQYRLMGESMVRREVLRDWTVAEGSAFYPEYANHGGMARFGFRANGLLVGFIYRGYDFGHRRPVCIWLQIGSSGRVYVLRELVLKDVDSYTFADLVKFYSGQIAEAEMIPSAAEVYAQLVVDGLGGPWFPPKVPFLDISGPECFATTPNAKPNDPRTTYDIFAAAGIALEAPRILINDRVEVMRKLLHLDRSGRPSILVDERCTEIHAMFNGGLSFPKGTLDDPTPNHPRKDGWFDNIHDGLTYPLGQLIPAAGKAAPTVRKSYGGQSGRTLLVSVDDGEEESLGFYESRGGTR